jgi:hypothetical protein
LTENRKPKARQNYQYKLAKTRLEILQFKNQLLNQSADLIGGQGDAESQESP